MKNIISKIERYFRPLHTERQAAEDVVIECARALRHHQVTMQNNWAEADDAKKQQLWASLHRAGFDLFQSLAVLDSISSSRLHKESK